MRPPRVLWEIRKALGREDILVSDVGMHKLWIARMFPAHEPDTVFIANGLAGMGIALPTAIAAKLVHPDRKVVTVSGDGGFLMNCQELETAKRLKTRPGQRDLGEPAVRLDRVEAGQQVRPPLRRRLHQPGLRRARAGVRHARASAARRSADFAEHLDKALALDEPSVVVVPIDYSQDIGLQEQLGKETVAA